MLIFFALTDGTPLNCADCCDFFAKNVFPASFRQKSCLKVFEFFRNWFDILHCPLRFLTMTIFLQTYLEDPFTYCSAALAKSKLTAVELFGGRDFFTGKFSAKTIGNPDFFGGKFQFVALLWPTKPCMASKC